MKYYRLGSSGLKVSALGLGTNSFGGRADEQTSTAIIHTAIENGITFIDTANIYTHTESERIIGQALEGKRHEVVLATKAGLVRGEGPNQKGSSRYHLMQELENSLKRLRTDYVDLYQIHTIDPETPLEETLRALDDMVRSGKVRYIGASNYAAWELMKAIGISRREGLNRYVSTQVSYSLADRTPERELVPLCLDQGVGIIPYFPLAGGILTGKYTSTEQAPAGSRADKEPRFVKMLSPDKLELSEQVGKLAGELGVTSSVLSLTWLMHKPTVSSVIVGATSAKQLTDNLQSATLDLDEASFAALENISDKYRNGEPFAVYRLS
ncbi:oxidoreductase [Brevibacillus reuszeri]|uniref:Aldo/keto reductase n=1 Tax=Brevibacillus reuszeri TaxID=54915 RepID=A0A0K9Z0E8_9BACL|nr:aldo/keto reductase [Brevibacillus reuszeri]KNB74342.1 aldo/keto reductase [Brevibacillus reuszeri]MED1856242.1 aldo/keto reductase [Brevibacillus reuszeri]GED68069.1 oxidoreductase [Brevibacillus reuszeri]